MSPDLWDTIANHYETRFMGHPIVNHYEPGRLGHPILNNY